MGINHLTPSQLANIELALGRNRWLGLLKQALEHNKEHPNTTEIQEKPKTP